MNPHRFETYYTFYRQILLFELLTGKFTVVFLVVFLIIRRPVGVWDDPVCTV